ncbi:FtsQ-type POTRA domain-containing protein [uncultured Brachyspira sp.]|uniref:cell division protein FtsQ/DivIB n=1 Tax=uncultured Brachyspira sp. TaxID=221953 RepID=UPI002617E435|nr:FtsQ-type POTRA domain-containing protein [uncultured Brachyspira sp.]
MKNLKENKLRKKLNKNKLSDRQKNIIKRTAVIFILIIIIAASITVINKARILRVEIRGLNKLNAIDIMEESNLSKYNNTSLFNIPKKEITKDIEDNPRVKVENIKASFPDLLIINVSERDNLFLLESNTGIYEITDEGYIIKNESIYNYDVPYVTGLNINPTNKKIENEYSKYLSSVIYELKTNYNEIYNLISEINAFGNDLILYPRGYQVQVILEKYVKAEKFVDLTAILKTIQNQGTQTYRIDFRFKEAIIN